MDIVRTFELGWTLFLQGLGGWLAVPMRLLSTAGMEEFFMAVMPAIFWCLDASTGLRVGMMLMLSNGLNEPLKILFHGPRPYWISTKVHAYLSETSFGMPSNHAQNAAAIWGLLAALIRRAWFWVVIILLILGIALSRVYLGVHFTSDVLVGLVIGALMVIIFVKLDPPITAWVQRTPSTWLMLAAGGTSFLFIGLHFLAKTAAGAWQIPASWMQLANVDVAHAADGPYSISSQVTVAGVWFGMLAGSIWLWRSGGFLARGTLLQKLARYGIGVVGVGLLYLGLGSLLPKGEDLLGESLRYLRYACIGGWVAAGAPWLFCRLGLARRSQTDLPIKSEPRTQLSAP